MTIFYVQNYKPNFISTYKFYNFNLTILTKINFLLTHIFKYYLHI